MRRAFLGVAVSVADCGIFGVAVAVAPDKNMFVAQQHPSRVGWGGDLSRAIGLANGVGEWVGE